MQNTLILDQLFVFPFRWKFNYKNICLLGFFSIIALISFYVFQMNALTKSSFAIADYEQHIIMADKEFKNLQTNFSNASSLSSLEQTLIAGGFEKVGKIHYIQVLDDTVAVR